MTPQQKAKFFLISLFGLAVVAGLTVTLVGIYGRFPNKSQGGGGREPWEDPSLNYVKTPSLDQLRNAFQPDICLDDYVLDWQSGKDGQLYVNGAPFFVKGISWFGCEGRGLTFTGLNYTTTDTILNFFSLHKFNTVRIPVGVTFALAPKDYRPNQAFVAGNLKNKSIWDILDYVIDECAKRGLMVMLDMHTLEPQLPSPLWYDGNVSEDDVLRAWDNIMRAYSKKWNVFALDIKNEPHGVATWGNSNPKTDYNKFYERAIDHISNNFPDFKGLYLVEGVQFNAATDRPTDYPFWWGGNFGGAVQYPINVNNKQAMTRIVYSPHVYGPDVYRHKYFDAKPLDRELDKVWDSQMGWLISQLRTGTIVGEWGGSLKGEDKMVQQHLAKWLVKNCMANNIWWAINPESGDTGGIMAWNWRTYDKVRLDLVDSIFSDPSAFGIRRGRLCYHLGTYPNPACPIQPYQQQPGVVPQKLRG